MSQYDQKTIDVIEDVLEGFLTPSMFKLARGGPDPYYDRHTPAHMINTQAFSGTAAAKGKRGKRRERGRRKAINRERRILLGAFGLAAQFPNTSVKAPASTADDPMEPITRLSEAMGLYDDTTPNSEGS